MELNYLGNEAVWARQHFGLVDLGDERRSDRLSFIAHAWALQPGLHLPSLFARPYDVKAAYTLIRREEMVPDAIQSTHRELVFQALHDDGETLLLEDTTEVTWPGRGDIDGLGPVGGSKEAKTGLHLHSVLAVRWHALGTVARPGRRPAVEILGVADQQYHVRVPQPKGERGARERRALVRERESDLWELATRRLGDAPEREGVRWVRVCDAAADIYEHLRDCRAQGHGYVIRSWHDRRLVDEAERTSRASLYERVRSAPSLGSFNLHVHGRAGQAAREAEIHISVVTVKLRAPQRPGVGPGTLPPIVCSAVRAWEPCPPEGKEPIEWVLLCDGKVEGFEAARTRVRQYASRWFLEEYHKVLKTGLKVEDAQLRTGAGLKALVAIASVVAVRLLALQEQAKADSEQDPEQVGLDTDELAVLRAFTGKPIATVREAMLAIGRMGGHMNRRRDGMPGWQTLWRGMARLSEMVEGYRLARKAIESG